MLVKAAKYWPISLSIPALATSSLYIASASWTILTFSAVTSPIILIPRPGPGKGCLNTSFSGIPSSSPALRTSSLNNNLSGSIISLKSTQSGSPPTLWCDLITADLPNPLSITSGYIVPWTR